MAVYRITASYEYSGEVEADSEDEARKAFWHDLNDYYSHTIDEEIEELEECEQCGRTREPGCYCPNECDAEGVCDRCGYEPCVEDAIDPPCTEENYLSSKERNN